jgi:phage baseplate assembly protein W|tara:strand:- start:40 stop:450 length:411 start_codon:yes stop_codon:yes gene_type:complete
MATTQHQHSDFDINFNRNEFINDVSLMKDRYAIRQSIMNIVMTRPGEKPFAPGFGVGVHQLLFENWTPLDEAFLERDIIWAVRSYEPRAEVESVSINHGDENTDANEITMKINFIILGGKESNPRDSIQLEIARVR